VSAVMRRCPFTMAWMRFSGTLSCRPSSFWLMLIGSRNSLFRISPACELCTV